MWDRLMADLGLRDVYREVEGSKARMFTRLGHTVHTRIDCMFAPYRAQDHQWYSISTSHASHASWSSDHLTLVAQMKKAAPSPNLGKSPPRINPEIFKDALCCSALTTLYQQVREAYPAGEYGHKPVWGKTMASMAHLMRGQSADIAKKPETNKYFEAQKAKHLRNAQASDPSRKFSAIIKRVEKARKKAAIRTRPTDPHSNFRRTQFEEVSTKQFYNNFKAKHERRYIHELYKVSPAGEILTPGLSPKGKPLPPSTVHEPSDMLHGLTTYYAQLMSDKASNPEAAEKLLAKLRERPLSARDRKSIEGAISEEEVLEAIAQLATGKSPGPDGVPPEFYRRFATLLAGDLASVYNECYADRSLTPNMSLGEIILLYKKKDPRDARNYRPITLLNLDYKILTKILVGRLKKVIDTVISEQQTGFVPGRVITWNSHLLNLIQAYLDETDEEGLFIFLDCEKAFDRCSWPFIRNAARAIGLGPNMCGWIDTLYSEETPPHRRVVCNNHRGEYFPLKSGVPQGCPASPIVFLLITEGLTRLVNDDPELKGITILGQEYKISQFADDTVFLLRNFESIKRMWQLITEVWEPATGMKVNVTKTEGLRLGRLRRPEFDSEARDHVRVSLRVRGGQAAPELSVSKGWGIKWCKKGDYLISLGIPIGWDFCLKTFWRTKYYKCKSLMARWHDVERMSPQGSAMVANAMVYSRFRYWAHCLAMSKEVREAINRDVQALIWGKDIHYDPEEMGSEKVRGYMKHNAQFNGRKGGGLSLLYWDGHEKALTSYTLFQYNNGRSMAWKGVLDWWFNKFQEGRGAVFSTIPTKHLTASRAQGRASRLPLFYKRALSHLRELKLIPVQVGEFTSQAEAQAEPMWTSPRISLTNRSYAEMWRYEMENNRLQDLIDPFTGELYTTRKIKRYITTRLHTEGAFIVGRGPPDILGLRQRTYTPISKLLTQWESFGSDVGERTLALLGGEEQPLAASYSRIAQQLMRKLGWKPGEGIGRRGQGVVDPHLPPGQTSRAGLGSTLRGTAQPANKPEKKDKEKVMGFEASDGRMVYGYQGERNGQQVIEEVSCTGRGRLFRNGKVTPIPMNTEMGLPIELREALLWDGGPVGLAETSFPHPLGWTFEGALPEQTLEHNTIRTLTTLFRKKIQVPPSCEDKWPQVLGHTVPMRDIWEHFTNPLLTPRDTKNHFRVVHRSLYTRNLGPRPDHQHEASPEDESDACRLCLMTQERFSHLAECYSIRQVFGHLAAFIHDITPGTKVAMTPSFIYLGLTTDHQVLPPGLSALHTMVWKFLLIDFVKVDTEKASFKPENIWKAAVLRLNRKVEARFTFLTERSDNAFNLGKVPPPLDTETHTFPLATFQYVGHYTVEYITTPSWLRLVEKMGCDDKV